MKVFFKYHTYVTSLTQSHLDINVSSVSANNPNNVGHDETEAIRQFHIHCS